MLIGAGIGIPFQQNVLARLLGSAEFFAPLTHSAIPTRAASGTTATFTRATTATFRDWEGVLKTVPSGCARFEGARMVRNLLLSSENLLSGWIAAGAASVTPDAIAAPTGAVTADALIEDNTSAFHRINHNSITRTSGQVIVVSVYAKYAGRNLFMNWSSFCNATGAFDLQTGVVTQGAGTASIEEVGDGWYRCSVKGTCSSTGADNGYLQLTPTNVSASYAGDGVSGTYFWGAQLEEVTGQADQSAGEYVSVGVESAPYYHGSFVDGVKCFPTDLSGNPLPTAYTYDAVSLNGVAGTYVSTPDSVAASITGDIDIRVKVALTDWVAPAANNMLVSKLITAGQYSYDWYVLTGSDFIRFRHSPDGTTVVTSDSDAAVSFTDGNVGHVRVTRSASTGIVTFYTSIDGVTWNTLGNPIVSAAGAIFNGNTNLAVGANSSGASPLNGKIYRAQIYNGINGTLAVDFDASRYAGGTTLTGSTSETWTLNGSAVIHPTNSPMLGYQAEGARTNLCTKSQEFDAWTGGSAGAGSNPVVTANAGTAPDGTATADKVVFSAPSAGDLSVITSPAFATVAASVYTSAVYVKAFAAGDVGKQLLTRQAGASGYTAITLSADWQRLGTTETAAGVSTTFDILLRPTFGGSSGTVSCYLWGAQVELGSSASSYIATTTIAVTRNADVLTYSSAGNIDGTKGWCYAELGTNWASPGGQKNALGFSASIDGLINHSGSIATGLRIYDNTNSVEKASLPTMQNSRVKYAASWGGSSMAITGAGAAVASGSFDGSIGGTIIAVGCSGAGGSQWDGTIRNVRIGQRQLSASELQAITS